MADATIGSMNGEPGFGPVGHVAMIYKGIDKNNDVMSHLYEIDGAGLENRGGKIWFRKSDNMLMGFKIELPDENSYQNVSFQFDSSEQMTESAWEDFKKSQWLNP